jgi:hypothetical protein
MYGNVPAYHALLWRIYSKLFTMTLAFSHPLREGQEVFQGRKVSIGIMMVPPPFPSCERDLRLRAFAGRLANSIISDSRCSTSPSANALAHRIEKKEQATDDDPAKECPCVCEPRLTHHTTKAEAEGVTLAANILRALHRGQAQRAYTVAQQFERPGGVTTQSRGRPNRVSAERGKLFGREPTVPSNFPYVCCGSNTSLLNCEGDVRFTPNCGRRADVVGGPSWAMSDTELPTCAANAAHSRNPAFRRP